jgi:hypothetical protein
MEQKKDYNRLVNRKKINNAVRLDLLESFEDIVKETGYNKSKLLDASLVLLDDLYKEDGIQGLQKLINRMEKQKDLT